MAWSASHTRMVWSASLGVPARAGHRGAARSRRGPCAARSLRPCGRPLCGHSRLTWRAAARPVAAASRSPRQPPLGEKTLVYSSRHSPPVSSRHQSTPLPPPAPSRMLCSPSPASPRPRRPCSLGLCAAPCAGTVRSQGAVTAELGAAMAGPGAVDAVSYMATRWRCQVGDRKGDRRGGRRRQAAGERRAWWRWAWGRECTGT
jgi:hypothetical protein